MNIPNRLTVFRIILTFVFMFFLFTRWRYGRFAALATFLVASYTDYLDGAIAKKMGLISDFGKFMDPIADKILIIAAFLAFVEMGLVPAWSVVLIIFREFVITGLRIFGIIKGHIVAASRAGKHKTVSQIVTVLLILVYLVMRDIFLKKGMWSQEAEEFSKNAIFFMVLVTVALTLVSGVSYIYRNKRLFL